MSAAILLEGLGKNFSFYKKEAGLRASIRALYRRKQEIKAAVSDFSMTIRPGEMIGLLGPNGAGKTTLMKMCTGLVVPSAGIVRILGYEPHVRDYGFRKSISLVMGQKSQLWWDLPAADSLHLLRNYYEVPKSEFETRLNNLAERLEVAELLSVQIRKLSLGERMKMELLACLLHQPKVIFLDEPTIGLDVNAQQTIRQFLEEYHRKHECTIVLTSHYMADVVALCSRIVLILGGRKRFDGSTKDFGQVLGREKIVSFVFHTSIDRPEAIFSDFKPMWNDRKTEVELRIPDEKLREISGRILADYPVIDFHTEKTPIERVMAELTANPALLE